MPGMMLLRGRRWHYQRKATHAGMREFLRTPVVAANTLFRNASLLAVDLETTSLEPRLGEIVSIGWVPIEQGKVMLAGAAHYFIAPDTGVGQSATIHHISDTALAGAGSVDEALEKLMAVAAGKVMVFHNAQLDMAFLNRVSRRMFGVPWVVPVIDTMRVEQIKLSRLHEALAPGELRLFACRERYGLPDYPAHNALMDAVATAELLLAQVAYKGRAVSLSELI